MSAGMEVSARPGIALPEGLRAAPRTRIGAAGRAGIAASLALLGVLTLWAHFAVVGGAVVAAGEVAVRGQPKEVQSLDGGAVAAIEVAEGDRVAAGDVLVRLDPALIDIEMGIEASRLADAVLRERRLQAEYAGAEAVDFSNLAPAARRHLAGQGLDAEMDAQREVFTARREVLEGLGAQLSARAEQAGEEIAGIEAQLGALGAQLDLVERERETARELRARGLLAENGMLDVERRHAALAGEIAALRAGRARAEAGLREARLEVVQAERRFRETAVAELREATLEREQSLLGLARLEERRARAVLRAPVDGIVQELAVATLGGAVAPGGTVMRIVPLGEGVEIAVRVEPRAIDEVQVGQPARIILPAFGRGAPELHGRVARVAPSAVSDARTGQSSYAVALEIAPEEMARLDGVDLIPGMPIEAFLQTGDRPVLSYLLRPLADHLRRAFREG